jgi:hypothetical protein
MVLASAVTLGSESRGTYNHILLSQIGYSPNLEGHVPVFISPRNRVVRLYPQALGSLFVASYDSQGHGGGTRPRLHTGEELIANFPFTINREFASARTACKTLRSSILTLLRVNSLQPSSSNGRLYSLRYSGFQASRHIVPSFRLHSNLRGCNVGVIDVMDLWSPPLRWAQVP